MDNKINELTDAQETELAQAILKDLDHNNLGYWRIDPSFGEDGWIHFNNRENKEYAVLALGDDYCRVHVYLGIGSLLIKHPELYQRIVFVTSLLTKHQNKIIGFNIHKYIVRN